MRLASAVLILTVAFAIGLFQLRQQRSPAARGLVFLLVFTGWTGLTVLVARALHLLVGEVALGWVVALALSASLLGAISWRGRQRSRSELQR